MVTNLAKTLQKWSGFSMLYLIIYIKLAALLESIILREKIAHSCNPS